jgi:hypothetical protein
MQIISNYNQVGEDGRHGRVAGTKGNLGGRLTSFGRREGGKKSHSNTRVSPLRWYDVIIDISLSVLLPFLIVVVIS